MGEVSTSSTSIFGWCPQADSNGRPASGGRFEAPNWAGVCPLRQNLEGLEVVTICRIAHQCVRLWANLWASGGHR